MDIKDAKGDAWGSLIAIGKGSMDAELTRDKTTIGRKDTNHIFISNNKLSAVHCCITREPAGVFVEDLSSNGTFVNDTKMSKGAKLQLNDGDKLWLLHPSKIKEPVGYEYKKAAAQMAVEPPKVNVKSPEKEKEKEKEPEPDKSVDLTKKKQ